MSGIAKPEFAPLLAAGMHLMSLDDIEALCVSAFPQSMARGPIMAQLRTVVAALASAKISGSLWVDGSFLTKKVEPGDVDLCLCIRAEQLLCPKKANALHWFRHSAHALFPLCHPNLCFIASPGMSDLEKKNVLENWKYWRTWLGTARSKDPKGIAVVRMTGSRWP